MNHPHNNDLDSTLARQQKIVFNFGIVEQIILGVAGILITMLAIRFVLALLGANADNSFADFIYGFTNPMVAPFYDLFSYDHPQIGVSKIEGFTLVAIVVYSLISAGVAKLFSSTQD